MKHPILALCAIGFAGVAAGSAMTYVDSVAGPGTARAAVSYGTGNAADLTGEAAAAGPKVGAAVVPAIRGGLNVVQQGLGSAAPQSPTTTAPPDGAPESTATTVKKP